MMPVDIATLLFITAFVFIYILYKIVVDRIEFNCNTVRVDEEYRIEPDNNRKV